MKLSLDTLGKSFAVSLRPAANITAFFHLIIGFAGMAFMSFLGNLTGVSEVSFVFMIIGAIFFIFVIFRCAFILNQMAISELRDNKKVSFGEAQHECNRKQIQLILLPAIFVGILLVEFLIIWLLGLIPQDSILGLTGLLFTVFSYPFYIINFVIFFILVMGGGIFIPIMIDQDTGAVGSIKGIILTIKQQFLRLLISQLAVSLLAAGVFFIFYLVDMLAASASAEHVSAILGQVEKTIGSIMMLPSFMMKAFENGAILQGFTAFFQFVFVIIIFSAIAAYFFNLLMTLYSTFYLGFIKDHINFKEELSLQNKK